MKENKFKSFPDNLSRFRNDIVQYGQKFGGLANLKKKNFKAPMTRKEKRKLERKLKHAKNYAFSRKEEMPTLQSLVKPKKDANEKSLKTDKKNVTKNDKTKEKKDETTIEMIETKVKNEEAKKKNFEKESKKNLKQKLIEENELEEKEIRKLEKLLHIKKGVKKIKKSFYDEGMGDLLEFCDDEKRQEILKNGADSIWLDAETEENSEDIQLKKNKKAKIEKLNKNLYNDDKEEEVLSDEGDFDELSDSESYDDETDFSDTEQEDSSDPKEGFFIKAPKIGKNDKYLPPAKRDQIQKSLKKTKTVHFNEEMNHQRDLTDEEDEENFEDFPSEDSDKESDETETDDEETNKSENGLKEDIYGRLVNKEGQIVKSEKYVPPAQRLKNLIDQSSQNETRKLTNLSKQLNGLLNRLSTSNMHSICNQIIQMFYSNQYTRYDLIDTLFNLLNSSLIQTNNLSPIRLLIEHAALVAILSANIGVELGATILQKFANILNKELNTSTTDLTFRIENKTLDNLILFICNLYNFKLFSSSLLNDLLSDFLIENLTVIPDISENSSESIKIEKSVDLILIILKCVGFSLRKDDPVALKNIIVKLQSKINEIKSKFKSNEEASINCRLKFMIESINAIKNNDMRRLDAYDQQPIEVIRKQMKTMLKEEKDSTQLNIKFKDLINANELGRWWIVGSAWSLKENSVNEEKNESNGKDDIGNFSNSGQIYSEKILQLAKAQHMNTDIRRAIFCIIVTAEDYTDAFVKLIKLSLKKQQEREIIYVIVHCALNEKRYNPYYSYLLQKFVEYDRRFKFHTWDKFKLLESMKKNQITNFSSLYSHLIGQGCMSLSVLKNIEFGEMNKSMLQFLRELFTNLFNKYNDEQLIEILMRIATVKKMFQLRNALKLFIVHFMLTDRGKMVSVDEKIKSKCELTQKILTPNAND